MRLLFNDFYGGSRCAEEETSVIYFICQWPSLARCRYRIFGSPFLVSLTELPAIDIKDIASYIDDKADFPAWGSRAKMSNNCQILPLP